MKYHSKIGLIWITAIAVIAVVNYMIFRDIEKFDWSFFLIIIVLGLVDVLFICATFDTWYQLHDDYLEIKCGVFFHEEIPYSDIVKFKESKNPLSSVGLSIDRLDILYKAQKGRNGNSEVLISPMRKQEFIKILEEKTHKKLTVK